MRIFQAAERPSAAGLQPLRQTVGGGLPVGTARRRILVVEDDHLVAMDLEAALHEAGFAVVGTAATAEDAIALARAERPALAIMDIRLASARDGIDAALELFRGQGLRCIFATAHSDAATKQRAQPARPLGWLAKPYQPRVLVETVRRALSELDAE
jgi:DNA-binding NarL/FixJ family response regulator